MEPIRGVNNSLAIALIAAQYMEDASKLDTAKAKLALDAMKDGGEMIVKLLEGLGENIDLYA